LKVKFTTTDKESYELAEEDVEGLKKSKADILTEKKALQDKLDELTKFKTEKEAEAQKAKVNKLEEEQEYKKALAEKEKAWNERFDAEKAEKESLFADIKRERLTNELVKRGALADRAGYLVGELDAHLELAKDEAGKFTLKKKGGIGDATEFDSVIEAAKQKTPFFFAASGASGSGASGSQQSSGSGNQIKRSQYDANPGQYADALGKGELTLVPD
jgi:hypothetical protein